MLIFVCSDYYNICASSLSMVLRKKSGTPVTLLKKELSLFVYSFWWSTFTYKPILKKHMHMKVHPLVQMWCCIFWQCCPRESNQLIENQNWASRMHLISWVSYEQHIWYPGCHMNNTLGIFSLCVKVFSYGTGIIWARQTFQNYFDVFLKPYRISGNKERFTFQTKYWYRSRFLKAVVSQVFSHVLYVEKNSNHSIFNWKFSEKSSFTSWKFIKES